MMKSLTKRLKKLRELVANNSISNLTAIDTFAELLKEQGEKNKFFETETVLEEIEKLNALLEKNLKIKTQIELLDIEYENLFINVI